MTYNSVRSYDLTLYETATGLYYLPTDAHDDIIANHIKANAVFDAHIVDIAKKYIKEGTIALDVGSNFGQMSVLMAHSVGPTGMVYAFEADDFVFSILSKNAALNAQNIVSVFGAVHNEGGELLYFPVQDFERFGTYGSYGIDYIHGRGRPVPTLAIDDIKFSLPISFMKIDVQGGDLFAMQGAVKTIAKHQMPIIFEYEYLFEEELNLNFQEYTDFVQSIGYYIAEEIHGQNYLILPKSTTQL
ncbi:MAG: FkbM family methyltransferase [Formosimonas sp.]